MFFGNFGERFPYTNFHDLNLDWIIAKVKEDISGMDEVTKKVNEFQEYIDNIDGEIQEHIEETIPEAVQTAINQGIFNQVLEASRQRRIVFIGDSYGEGYTPDGNVTGFPTLVKNMMGLSNDNCFIFNQGGARFGASAGSEYAFDTVISNNVSNVTHPETITDIVIAGGYNDSGNSVENINTGIARCKSVIATYFTNPSLRVHLFAIGYNCISPSTRNVLFRIYNACYAKSGWSYTKLTPSICYGDYWATDGYHPLQAGQNAIACNIANILNGGISRSNAIIEEYAQTDFENVVLYNLMTENGFDSTFHVSGGMTYETPITLNHTTPAKICDITTKLPIDNIPDDTKRIKYPVHAIVSSGSTYYDVVLLIQLTQTARNTVEMTALIFQLNDTNTNYLALSDIDKIQIASNNFHMFIPYEF